MEWEVSREPQGCSSDTYRPVVTPRSYGRTMRYRRYYVRQNKDGSRTVVSHGPCVTLGRKIWDSWLGAVLVAALAGALTSPWKTGTNLGAENGWIFGWMAAGFILHFATKRFRQSGKLR